MFGKIAFIISIMGLTIFISTALSNFILEGVYGLRENKVKMMISFGISAIFFGIYLVLTSPGALI